jgi:lipoprotein NlpD
MQSRERAMKWLGLGLAGAVLAGCASPQRVPAPVEDRMGARHGTVAAEPARSAALVPGAENAGKAGYYTVRPGDTLVRIALETGQNWRDIARWNGLDNPNVIESGQVLRVAPPGSTAVAVAPAAGAPPSSVTLAVPPASAASSTVRGTGTVAPAATSAGSASSPAQPAAAGEEELAFAWPTPGAANVLAGFDEQKNKGLDIGGRAGDPVYAAADGRVVYAGAGLRGYGNLIILKHNNTYLTAYAHNQSLLVKEDQSVRKGQKIAEMGSTDTDRVKLHFEIRRQGKPVDPTRYLPPR